MYYNILIYLKKTIKDVSRQFIGNLNSEHNVSKQT